MHPSHTRETTFNKDEEKHGQRGIPESRDIRQVPDKRRVEDQSQKSRFADKRRVYVSCTGIKSHPQQASVFFAFAFYLSFHPR